MTVNLFFHGICTHTRTEEGSRTILVNASDPRRWSAYPQMQGVQPHVATLQIRRVDLVNHWTPARDWFPITFEDEHIIEWTLLGVTLTIGFAAATAGERVASCVPTLTNATIVPPVPPLRPLTQAAHKDYTACYVDLPACETLGWSVNGAAVVEIRVESPTPSIDVVQFGTNEPVSFPIRDQAPVSIANIPIVPDLDKPNDFLLHFLATDTIPQAVPPMSVGCARIDPPNKPRNIGDTTGPGCSNSNYP